MTLIQEAMMLNIVACALIVLSMALLLYSQWKDREKPDE